jgi:dTDP-4-amino-4,6-dideoxygalactose transaminase
MKIPFSPPRIDQLIIDEVIDTLKSGWITTGPKTKKFEKMLADYTGAPNVLCLNSATAGLELMLRWFGVGEGDEVIVPAYTYAASANVIIHCGAKPVFVDSAADFNLDVALLEKLITPRTKVIIPVDIAGFPCDYDYINALVRNENVRKMFVPQTPEQEMLGRILVLSDAAHSLGAYYNGIRAGILSDLTVFSFHAVKNLTTAEGGAVCLNLPTPFDNDSVYKYLNIKSLHGQNKDALAKIQVGNWRYDIVEAGYKYNMTDIQAAMGIVELERYDSDMLRRRKQIFDRYAEKLGQYEWAELPVYETAERRTSYHVFLLRISGIDESRRDAIMQAIFAEDVAVNVHFVPLPMFSFYRALGYNIKDYPVAYANYACEISLPVYYDLADEMVDRVVEVIAKAVES